MTHQCRDNPRYRRKDQSDFLGVNSGNVALTTNGACWIRGRPLFGNSRPAHMRAHRFITDRFP
ncbi:hypothetical protein P3T22_003634 [Paraburkholderia sp. GAS348]